MTSLRTAVALGLAGAFSLLAIAGCKKERSKRADRSAEGTAAETSAAVRKMIDTATERIVEARCERDAVCDPVRYSQRAEQLETCRGLMRAETVKELNPAECPGGVDEVAVARCVAAIEQTGCIDPVGAVMRLGDCGKDELCRRQGS